MSEESEQTESEQQQKVVQQLNNLRSDFLDVKESVVNEQQDAKRTSKKLLSNNKWLFASIVVISGTAIAIFAPEFYNVLLDPPEITYVFVIGGLTGSLLAYPAANYLVGKFVDDTRKPVFEIDPEDHRDIGVWVVPKNRTNEIEVLEGEKRRIETSQEDGYEVEKFEKVVDPDTGKEHLIAKASWIGEKSGLEIRKSEQAIKAQREQWKPKVKTLMAMEIAWPYIIHRVQEDVINKFTEEFQEGVNFRGNEIRQSVEDTLESYKPENMQKKTNDMSIEDLKEDNISEEKWAQMDRETLQNGSN
jgi:hypothetical protein